MKVSKLFIALSGAAMLLTACQTDSFKIKGTAEGFANGDTLLVIKDMTANDVDTIFISDGKFSYEGVCDSVKLCYITTKDTERGVMFFNEPGKIEVSLPAAGTIKIGGTKANDALQQFMEIQMQMNSRADSLGQLAYGPDATEETRSKAIEEFGKMQEQLLNRLLTLAEENVDNEFAFWVLLNTDPSMIDQNRVMAIIDKLPNNVKERQQIKDILSYYNAQGETAEGKPMKDFTLKTPEDAEVSAKELVAQNKITIIDFWASWCGPCRQEMPNLVNIYKKYQPKGLGIIGVSLDEDKDEWVAAIKDLNITWPQMSDLGGWESAPVSLYQINAIPFTLIVDQNGTILAKNLRGAQLEEFIAKNFAE